MTIRSPDVEWYHFVQLGDEFLVSYACVGACATAGPVPAFFLASHAAELYLKACLVKQGLLPSRAIKYRHNISSLIADCMDSDPAFPRDFELKQHVQDLYKEHHGMLSEAFFRQLGSDSQHFADLQELYQAAYLQGDTKYYGLPCRRQPGQLIAFTPSPMWEAFFRALRSYLRFPPDRVHDNIRMALQSHGALDASAAGFLSRVAS